MNIKNEKGITLVALVITIIVMLILATVTIASTVGEDKIIEQTEDAVIKASEREVEEALEVKLLLKEKEKIKNGDFNGVKISELTDIVSPIPGSSGTYRITPEGLEILNVKGEYGKGTSRDFFKVQVELDGGVETKNFEVIYVQ